jgi:hypothetical protein
VFVVVVGVDARWLPRALKEHCTEMLDDPVDYLEKVFQVSFALRPMDGPGFRRLVSDLAEEEFGEASCLTPPAEPQNLPRVREAVPVEEEPGGSHDLTPRSMRITGPELLYLEQLSPLVCTPRAAKRLVNLYRLVKARTGPADADASWTSATGSCWCCWPCSWAGRGSATRCSTPSRAGGTGGRRWTGSSAT